MAIQFKKPRLQSAPAVAAESSEPVESATPSFASAPAAGSANYKLDGILAILTLVLLGATLAFQILEVVHY